MFHFWKKKQEKNSLIPVVIITAIVFILKSSFLIATSIRGLASMLWIIDDSFIEMKVAENLGHGLGFSLDGIHSTTGAPFLWIYLSSITHMLFGQAGAIKATLILSALLGALACIVVFMIAEKVTKDRRIAWTAFLLATFSGNAFFNAMNGMDTALFTFLVLLSIACALDVGRPKNWSSLAWGCVTGLALGLAVMTRGDGIFIIGSIVCMKCWEYWIAPRSEKHLHLNSLLGILAIAGVCFGIFMIWQLIQTGSPFPGNQIGRRMLQLGKHNFSFEHFSLPRYLTIVAWNVFQLEDLISLASGSALLAIVAFVSGLMQQQMKRLSVITILYLGVFFTLLVGYQWYFADLHGLRYINPAVHIFFIYVATLFWRLPSEYMKKCLAIFLILCTIILTQYKFYQLCSRFRWAQYMSYIGTPDPVQAKIFWGTIDWINENLPPETIVGVRDYGRISMFGDVKIQDLAGNIDPKVAEALENGTLDTYLKELKVEYLYIPSLEQRDEKLYRFLHSRLRLQQVKEAPVSPTQTLYKIQW